MKKVTTLSLITAVILGFAGCEGGSTKNDGAPTIVDMPSNNQNGTTIITNTTPDEDTKKVRKFVGIPSNIIVGECADINANFICDNEESTENKVINKNDRMLLKLQDKENFKHNDGKFVLAFDGSMDEVNLIDMLSYGQTDVDIESIIYASEESEQAFYAMVLKDIKKNLNTLAEIGRLNAQAQEENIKSILKELVSADIENFANNMEEECKGDETCEKQAYAALEDSLLLDIEEAYILCPNHPNDNNNTPDPAKIICEEGEIYTLQHYGVEDQYRLVTGVETAYPSSRTLTNPSVIAYNIANSKTGLANYDSRDINYQFADEIKNLPSNITNGRIIIGLKSNGSSLQGNDGLTIGNHSNSSNTNFFYERLTGLTAKGWQQLAISSPASDIYWNDFNTIVFRDSTNLLSYVQNHNNFDVSVQDDTSVDFITVATCSDPVKEVKEIINKFECCDNEMLVKVKGGTLDAFSVVADVPAGPTFTTTNPNPLVSYDATFYNNHFTETLSTIALGVITKAQLNIGYKIIGSSLSFNDTIMIGQLFPTSTYGGGDLYRTIGNNITARGWSVFNPAGYGKLAQANLNTITTVGTLPTLLDDMNTFKSLDIYVQDDTAIDFMQLNLCIKEPCGDDISIDLSKLANWTTKPADTIESNAVPGIWDNSLNWFKFDEAGHDRVLEIPFCACGDTDVDIRHLKGDNKAEVELGTTVAIQPGNTGGLTAFISDSSGGNHVYGSKNIPGTGTGVNHILKLKVHNAYSSWGSPTPFGVAVDGTLTFKGTLGKCQ